ncbi:hypothetical protein HRD49_18550 [Corallococcus exiguus]|uniref:hypothetical protein n=1 Tax=Corallococcus exiguus TaxID=83462 RepID=UPI001471D8B0|nr:hypothetical protein [Corallococcus exiguus]NNC16656.1 hypothetical protein [Corallococcus exiguus]NRD52497.1 hypothetical protein [Corallococcus exiguus]NRD63755.1 hypothetical protein [Corallococcus exiguus]
MPVTKLRPVTVKRIGPSGFAWIVLGLMARITSLGWGSCQAEDTAPSALRTVMSSSSSDQMSVVADSTAVSSVSLTKVVGSD